jgi:hypothetical protein
MAMKKERRSEAEIITAAQIDLVGPYLQLRRLRQMVQEAERLRATRRPRLKALPAQQKIRRL